MAFAELFHANVVFMGTPEAPFAGEISVAQSNPPLPPAVKTAVSVLLFAVGKYCIDAVLLKASIYGAPQTDQCEKVYPGFAVADIVIGLVDAVVLEG